MRRRAAPVVRHPDRGSRMRQIGTLPTSRDVARLADYLLAQGIKTRVEETAQGAAIWVYDEDSLERAAELLAEYTRDPRDTRYDRAAAAAREVEKEAARKEAAYRKNVVDVRARWDPASAGRQPLTMLLLAASIAATVVTNFGDLTNPWFGRLTIVPVTIEGDQTTWQPGLGLAPTVEGQLWRLITPIFVHMDLVHLLFNMYMLIVLGTRVELARGTWRMLALVLMFAVASNLGQFLWSHSPYFGGMSGVVYGLLGYSWMKSRFEHDPRLFVHPTNVFVMVGWFFLCMTPAVPRVANAAHAVGLVMGLIIGLAPTLWKRSRPQ
jgi:GlpG protein